MRSTKDRAAALIELHDLAVEHRVVGVQLERDLRAEVGELSVAEIAAREELGTPTVHIGERTEPVVLQLEDPLGVIERLPEPREWHGFEGLRGHAAIIAALVAVTTQVALSP
jgi:hypothetical protein